MNRNKDEGGDQTHSNIELHGVYYREKPGKPGKNRDILRTGKNREKTGISIFLMKNREIRVVYI